MALLSLSDLIGTRGFNVSTGMGVVDCGDLG